jgi:hydroxycarboxylate dehydrogenase B
MCAAAGLVSLHFVNITDQRPAVAPWRGSDGRFGTNPLCIALPGPAPDRPIIADMATSRIAMGKVRVARNKGEQVTAGTLLDSEGKPTTDPHVMYKRPRGALMTFGEHKGYALAFICEMLAGAVTGSGTMRPERQDAESVTNGMLTIAIDPSRLVDRAWMLDEIAAMAAYITASPPGRSGEPVLIPGDPERANRAHRLKEGVPIDEETWREITLAARGLNVLIETSQKSA